MVSRGSSNLDEEGSELRRGPWTTEEDNLLTQYIRSHGIGRWNSLTKSAGLKRTGKSCRLRWLNYLNPDTKRGNLTPHEQLLILELHSRWGNRWSKIAQHLPGRTDNEIKNYWRSKVQKQARQLKLDSNSKKFQEAIRLYLMPRLLEKMEQNSSASSSSASTSSSTSETPSLAVPPQLQIDQSVSGFYNSETKENSEFLAAQGSELSEKTFCYLVDIPVYDDMQELGCGEISTSDCQVSDGDWFMQEFENSFWNSDELWQFRKL